MCERSPVRGRDLSVPAAALVTVVMVVFLVSCLAKYDIVGRWREVGKTATIEFHENGTFKAVDNQGMAVAGRYTLLDTGRMRCEIEHEGSSDEVVIVSITIAGDELTVSGSDGRGVERYKRVR
jgi:hypothetical protein